MFDEGGKSAGICERAASQGRLTEDTTEMYLTHTFQEAEQAAYANMQGTAGQAAADVPAQHVQPTAAPTTVANVDAMDIDGDAAAQGTVGEGHGGIKRKAGEDVDSVAKKPRTGMFVISPHALATDTAIACRACRCCLEEVNSAGALRSFTF